METSSKNYWEMIKNKKRIVVKIGSSSLTHRESGNLNLIKLEKLVRNLCDLKSKGKDVILVSSGAVAVGRESLGIGTKPKTMAEKQACAAVGQCKLMMNYQKLFAEYGQTAAQVLMTKVNMNCDKDYENLRNTFDELLNFGAIPIVNENDAIATDEIEFGDNDTLSAIVTAITGADLLIILTDTDGLFTDDPSRNPEAKLIDTVSKERKHIYGMAKRTSDSDVGTGGMYTKVIAAKIANTVGADMVIANGKDVNHLNYIMEGKKCGTLFISNKNEMDNVRKYLVSQINR